jgi:hypothetical protein
MARHPRNYQVEYRRRTSLGAERGLTLRQARGHPRLGEPSIRSLRQGGQLPGDRDPALTRYFRVVARLAKGEPLRTAIPAEHISPALVHRINEERVLFGYTYRTGKRGQPNVFNGLWVRIYARMPILTTDGVLHQHIPLDKITASEVGTYWNAVDEARQGKPEALAAFRDRAIYDADGHSYRLLTDVNAIHYVFDRMSEEEYADFSRTFYSGREVRYVA